MTHPPAGRDYIFSTAMHRSFLMTSHLMSHPNYSDEHSSSMLCSLNVEIRFRLNVRAPRSRSTPPGPPPPYSKNVEPDNGKNCEESVVVVRQGPVRVKEDHARSWFFSDNWLVLSDTHLALHPSADEAPRVVIPLSDITKLERTESGPHSLILETRGNKTYSLAFKNDNDVYDWKDFISYRTTGVSDPWNFKHNVHVGWNTANGEYTGLPPEWVKISCHSPTTPTFHRGQPFAPLAQTISSTERILLRINSDTWTDPGHFSVGLSVLPDTLMRDVFEKVCLKTKLDTTECSLALTSNGNLTPLDMDIFVTVADLMHLKDTHNLILLTSENGLTDCDEYCSPWRAGR
ncbi:hypothetical protein B0H12DRAFT_1129934 [Mycena haematopus]|nr:hypothetical protein B0H12DRAFT_1129934 [Mycena haematopus]